MKKRRGKNPYISGYCAYAHGQHPCRGEFPQGSLVKPPVALCSCSCHGDYEERMITAGQRIVVEEDPEELEADDQ